MSHPVHAQGCGSRITCHCKMLGLTLDLDQVNGLLQEKRGPASHRPPRGWGTPGCPALYLGVHTEKVVRSPAAQRRALKRLAVVKVVVVFQTPNLQKERVGLSFAFVFLLLSFVFVFSCGSPHFCAGSTPLCVGAAAPRTTNPMLREGMQDAGTNPSATARCCAGTKEPRKHFYEFSPIKYIFANCLPSAPEQE